MFFSQAGVFSQKVAIAVHLNVQGLSLPEVLLITPPRFGDERGFFSETYVAPKLAAAGVPASFVQDNQSFSREAGTIRGLHCQVAPFVQGKLVRVLRGAIWDVAVDARPDSPTFGHYAAAELSADNFSQLWVPPGFLHGFCTLVPDTEVFYKVTALYDRASERGVIWNDPSLALPWPVPHSGAVLSAKDQILPGWAGAAGWFAAESSAPQQSAPAGSAAEGPASARPLSGPSAADRVLPERSAPGQSEAEQSAAGRAVSERAAPGRPA
jgi:dTDP-4-dehydrorhamnose 3,5-epimerase